MKPVKTFLFAALLVSTLAFNTYAGDIDIPGYVPPPPPRAMSTNDDGAVTSDSTIEQVGDTTAETSDYFLFETWAAFLSVY
jgi:hypothetical protein